MKIETLNLPEEWICNCIDQAVGDPRSQGDVQKAVGITQINEEDQEEQTQKDKPVVEEEQTQGCSEDQDQLPPVKA